MERKERSVRREGKPPYGSYDGGKQAKQPKGSSIGIHDGPKGHVGTSFKQEAKEQGGSRAMSPGMGSGKEHHGGEVAGIPKPGGSKLLEEGVAGHAKQPHGKSIGVGMGEGAEHHKGFGMGEAHSFKPPPQGDSHCFPGTTKRGAYRVSGARGAHMLGRR